MDSQRSDKEKSAANDPALLVKDLERGHRVNRVFLVENSNFKQTRNNKYFIQTDLRDRTGSIKGIRWEADRALFDSFRATDFVHVVGRVEEFQSHLQIIIDKITKIDDRDVEVEFFLPTSDKDIGALELELHKTIDDFEDTDLKALLDALLSEDEVRQGLRRCPAGKTLHHAWVGGLLEHIVSLCHAAKLICENYPQLNRDLLLTGVVLHDLGKLRELSFDRSFGYTNLGQLLGHIAIGVAWVSEVAKKIEGFPDAKLIQVQHLIASHHGEHEFGAIKRPMTREAVALHYLDNLDAKLSLLDTVEREQGLRRGKDGENGAWSDFHPAMGRRMFFP